MACDKGPTPTQNQIPCQALVACLIMDVRRTAEHCSICLPGSACVVRFVTGLRPQSQQAARSLPQPLGSLGEHFWEASKRGSPLPQLGGRWFEPAGAAPFPKMGVRGTVHWRSDAWNVRERSLWWAQP